MSRNDTHVLFLHGLESGPHGDKTRLMRAQGLTVTAPDLQMSKLRLDKRNSIARQILKQWEVPTVLAASVITALRLGIVTSAVATTVTIRARKRAWISKAVGASRRACVDIARDVLATTHAEVLVGSSWGGAIALELLRDGSWRGPTVLLAPASKVIQELVDESAWGTLLAAVRRAAAKSPIVVFHDPSDSTIDIGGSRELAAGSAVRLHEVQAGGHRLLDLVEDGRLAAVVRELAEAHPATQSC